MSFISSYHVMFSFCLKYQDYSEIYHASLVKRDLSSLFSAISLLRNLQSLRFLDSYTGFIPELIYPNDLDGLESFFFSRNRTFKFLFCFHTSLDSIGLLVNRMYQSVDFNSGQKMALRGHVDIYEVNTLSTIFWLILKTIDWQRLLEASDLLQKSYCNCETN